MSHLNHRIFGHLAQILLSAIALGGCERTADTDGRGTADAAEAPSSDTSSQQPPAPPAPSPPSSPAASTLVPEPEPTPAPEPEPEPGAMPTTNSPPLAPQPDPPSIFDGRDIVAAWGTEITLTGSALLEKGATLWVGDFSILPDDTTIVEWSGERLTFRPPFPQQGEIRVQTEVSTALGGSFTSEWQLGASIEMPDAAASVAAHSPEPGQLLLAIDTTPMHVLSLEADVWTQTALADDSLNPASFHFFRTQSGETLAFALTNGPTPELRSFDGGSGWQSLGNQPALGAFSEFAAAGGPLGAVLWLHRPDGWELLSNVDGEWRFEGSPVPQPGGLDQATPAATDDGSLLIVHAIDTGNFLDDHETPYVRRLRPGASEFEDRQIAGSAMDDHLTSLRAVSRGHGVALEYCGSDRDPLALTSTAYRCRSAGLSMSAGSVLRGPRLERAHYAFTLNLVGVGHCGVGDNTWLTAHYDTQPGVVLGWPCVELEALEIDPAGQWLPVVRHDGRWHLLSSDLHLASDPVPVPDLDAGADAGSVDAGSAEAGAAWDAGHSDSSTPAPR